MYFRYPVKKSVISVYLYICLSVYLTDSLSLFNIFQIRVGALYPLGMKKKERKKTSAPLCPQLPVRLNSALYSRLTKKAAACSGILPGSVFIPGPGAPRAPPHKTPFTTPTMHELLCLFHKVVIMAIYRLLF